MTTKYFKVKMEMPDGAAVSDAIFYLTDAASNWKAQVTPDDPMRNLDENSIKVTQHDPTPKRGRQ